jgi:hypothetical protein
MPPIVGCRCGPGSAGVYKLLPGSSLALVHWHRPAAVNAFQGSIQLPTYPWWSVLPHPYFQGTDSKNIYPYPMMNNLCRTVEPHSWRNVTLENEFLRVVFFRS